MRPVYVLFDPTGVYPVKVNTANTPPVGAVPFEGIAAHEIVHKMYVEGTWVDRPQLDVSSQTVPPGSVSFDVPLDTVITVMDRETAEVLGTAVTDVTPFSVDFQDEGQFEVTFQPPLPYRPADVIITVEAAE